MKLPLWDALSFEARVLLGALMLWRRSHDVLDRFEEVRGLVEALPHRINRGRVYRVLSAGVMLGEEVESLDPKWTQDRDAEYRAFEAALKRMRRVLARRELDDRMEALEREFLRLTTDTGLLARGRDRSDLSPTRPGGGRPFALWRRHTIRLLWRERVSIENAEALLSATGLSGPTPTAPKRPRKSRQRRK